MLYIIKLLNLEQQQIAYLEYMISVGTVLKS